MMIRSDPELEKASQLKTRALVEDHAVLTVAAVGEVGGFEARETWTELEGGRFKVRRRDDVLQVRFQKDTGDEVTAIVGLQIRRLPRSQSYYFTCPISGARLLKLVVVGGQLGGWKALGLDHRSRVQPQLYRQQQSNRAAVHAWPFSPIARTTSEGWAGELSSASEAEWIQAMAPWVRKARGGQLPSTRSRGIWDWGWARQQPELDADELDRLGLFKEGGRRIGFFSWPDKLGGVDSLIVATDLANGKDPMMVLGVQSGTDRVHQTIALERVEGHWRFLCPVEGEYVTKLYARSGRFASLQGQYLVLGLERPDNLHPDEPLTPKSWWPDEP